MVEEETKEEVRLVGIPYELFSELVNIKTIINHANSKKTTVPKLLCEAAKEGLQKLKKNYNLK
jgi:hypothetical protein